MLLTERGAHGYEFGIVTEIERPHDRSEGYELNVGPMFQVEFMRWVLNTNVLLTRTVAAAVDVVPQLGYQFQLRYRLGPAFEPGLQVFGTLGDATHWDPVAAQSHRAGPALFGYVDVGVHQRIRYTRRGCVVLTRGLRAIPCACRSNMSSDCLGRAASGR